MGRPWWYDSYWEKDRKQRRKFQLPKHQLWMWAAVLLLSLILTLGSRWGISWFLGFVYNLCRILTFAIFVRAILSWFTVNRYNLIIILINDITEPILSPLRRIVPRFGMFDFTPLAAIAILYAIPLILIAILS